MGQEEEDLLYQSLSISNYATGMFDACSVADERDAGEGFLEVEGPLGVIMGQSVEFFLVTLHLLDKVDKVTRRLY